MRSFGTHKQTDTDILLLYYKDVSYVIKYKSIKVFIKIENNLPSGILSTTSRYQEYYNYKRITSLKHLGNILIYINKEKK